MSVPVGVAAHGLIELSAGVVDHVWLAGSGDGGAPLVFLHEGLGSLDLWRDFPARLVARTGRDALVWSRHGYGASRVVREPRAVRYMHDEALSVLPELLDRLGVDTPVLVGHSDGASIALIHAGRAARAVAGVVALAPHVVVEDRTIAGIEAARRRYRETDLPARMARHHADADATFWGWNDVWLSPAFRSWSIEDHLPGVRCPVLAMQCVDDDYGTAEQLQRIAAGASGPVSVQLVAGRGHSPHLVAANDVTERIVQWLAGVG
jgi:pimeloyl-ACP methyl ester carboxylesterase